MAGPTTWSKPLVGLFGSTVLVSLTQTMAAAAAPMAAREFGRVDLASALMGAYLLVATVAGPLFGKLGDLYGRTVVLRATLGMLLAASLACGVAWSMASLITFRAVQGLGGGGLISVASATVVEILPLARRPRYQGLITSTTSAVTVAGPVVGGLVIQWSSWRGVFLLNVPVGLLLLAQLRHVPIAGSSPGSGAGRPRLAALDHLGAVLLVGGLGTLMVALQFRSFAGLGGRVSVVASLLVAVTLLLAFVRRERVAAEPIVPMRLFGDPVYRRCALLSAFGGAVLFATTLQLQQFLQLGLGVPASQAGLEMLPMFTTLALMSVASGRRLARRGRPGRHLVMGTALTAAGLALLSALTDQAELWVLTSGMIALGCGLGILLPALGLVVEAAAPSGQLGAAMSVFMMLRSVGGAAGTAVVGASVAAQLAGAAFVPARALVAGFPVLAVLAVPAVLIALTLRTAVIAGLGPRHRA
ncbi:MAG TPA: MFS transporter [Kineosporiaceae bacterium]